LSYQSFFDHLVLFSSFCCPFHCLGYNFYNLQCARFIVRVIIFTIFNVWVIIFTIFTSCSFFLSYIGISVDSNSYNLQCARFIVRVLIFTIFNVWVIVFTIFTSCSFFLSYIGISAIHWKVVPISCISSSMDSICRIVTSSG